MLDIDATFRPDPQVPDAPRARLDAASLLLGEGERGAAEAGGTDTGAEPCGAAPDPAAPAPEAAAACAIPPDADSRPVTPRRLLRFTSSRGAEDAPAVLLPVPNIFEGVFDDEDHLTDPRLLRSRARARALLAAHEARLTEAERNLWHDDPPPEAPPAPAAADVAAAAADAAQDGSGRRVRHLTAADIAPHRASDQPEPIQDSLRDRLRDVRAALYDPDPDAPPAAPANAALTERFTVQALNAALIVVALPVGLLVSAITLIRGEDLRLTARAVAVVGAGTALLQVVPVPLL